MSPPPIAPLYDDDDIARARAAKSILLTQEAAKVILERADREFLGAAAWAYAELRAALYPPEPQPRAVFQVKRRVR